MYGSNLEEYAQNVLDNKQIAVSTRAEWNMLIKRLPLENFTYPPVEIDLYNMVVKRYSNPRTRRGVLQTLNCLLGTKMKTGKPSHPVFDLPDFEELDSYIQTPKNKYQARCRMYTNLMLHAGGRFSFIGRVYRMIT
jgi:hypothetical protein